MYQLVHYQLTINPHNLVNPHRQEEKKIVTSLPRLSQKHLWNV